jgi:nucleotide-binding universal stress UspA family protein
MANAPDRRAAIVCGVDFSPSSRVAADVASALARARGERLLLVHAVPGEPLRGLSAGERRVRLAPQLGELARERRRLASQGTAVLAVVRLGRPDEVLVRTARRAEARLLVLSSLGQRAAGPWSLGSVAERVAATSPIPVVVVRATAPWLAWLGGRRPLGVFLAFDFSPSAEAAASWLRELREVGPCQLTVGYARAASEERERFGVAADPRAAARVERAVVRDLRERMTELLGEEPRAVRLAPGKRGAEQELLALADAAGADLVVTGTHQYRGFARLWHGSVSRGLLHGATASVACVPAPPGSVIPAPMPSLRRVLVGSDLGAASQRALAHALAVAPAGARVRIVHVVHPLAEPGGEFAQGRAGHGRHREHLGALERVLRSVAPSPQEQLGVEVETALVEHREVAAGLCEEAARWGADVLVLAAHEQRGLVERLLGSVSERVLERARCSVLVVHEPAGGR